MAIDHPDRVRRHTVLYIVRTYKIYTETDWGIAEDYYHFFFIQPADYPERMIGNDVPYYLNKKWASVPSATMCSPRPRRPNICDVSITPKPLTQPVKIIMRPQPSTSNTIVRILTRN